MPYVGAWRTDKNGAMWRVWAPRAQHVELVIREPSAAIRYSMQPSQNGYFEVELPNISDSVRYAFAVDGGPAFPDPASRWQPEGVHAPSALFSPEAYEWQDQHWAGRPREQLVLYELHVGTFTSEGTFAAVIPRLADLKELGVTAIEIMPIGQFPGTFGWGYDGVYWFAAQHSYGGPREFQKLVDACHAIGLAVVLDVIYNHLGPEGNYLSQYGPYFESHHGTPWGPAINYDGPESAGVRNLVLENVRYWLEQFHLDGLRLDAVQEIYDDGPRHLLADIATVAADIQHSGGFPRHIIAETNENDVQIVTPCERGGQGMGAIWNDEFHHAVHTLLTGEFDGYYRDFQQPSAQLQKVWNRVFAYDGCFKPTRNTEHGTCADGYSGSHFVVSIQTHDQVGNRAQGDRLHQLTSPAQQRLAAGLLLTAPYLPMLFMGEEYGEQQPFPFFCDFGDPQLQQSVREGRRREFADFHWEHELPDPTLKATRDSAVLSWNWEPGSLGHNLRALYRDLLQLRHSQPAFQDFHTRDANLAISETGQQFLQIRRGPAESRRSTILVVFHLSAETCRQSPFTPVGDQILLNSEWPKYGGRRDEQYSDDDWLPHEFRIYESSQDL